ncbi:MAG: hypothetical protein WD825_09490, partial [Gemmatimonadaceae bacterium]
PQLILVYFLLSLLVIAFWPLLVHSPIGWFYGYREDYLGPGLAMVRAGGLHMSPHVGSLYMTILLLCLYAGVKYNMVDAPRWQVAASIVAGVLLPTILASRSEMLAAAAIVSVIIWELLQRRSRGHWAFNLGFATLLTGGFAALFYLLLLKDLPLSVLFSRLTQSVQDLGADPYNLDSGLLRPFRYWIWGIASSRYYASPLFGTGGEILGYHNDWLIVLVSAGAIGITLYFIFVAYVAKIEPIYLVPFMLAGMTNAFLYAPQHFTLFMLLLGVTARLQKGKLSEAVPARQQAPPAPLTLVPHGA